MSSYMCRYDTIDDKKKWKPEILKAEECRKISQRKNRDLSKGAAQIDSGKTFLQSIVTKTDCISGKYAGESFFVKRKGTKCKGTDEPVYKINNVLCNGENQGLTGKFGCELQNILDIKELRDVLSKKKTDCVEKTVKSCYERGLFVNPITGQFKINVDKNDKETLDGIDKMNNSATKRDPIPADEFEDVGVEIDCESFENIDNVSNYINSIKEFNKPNYLNTIYYLLIFIFLFYIFMKLYTKKKII